MLTFVHVDSLQNHKWENAMTIDKSSWGFRREATLTDMLSIEQLLESLVTTVRWAHGSVVHCSSPNISACSCTWYDAVGLLLVVVHASFDIVRSVSYIILPS